MRNIPSYLPRHKVAEEIGVSISTIKRWEKIGFFPKPELRLFGKDYFYFPAVLDWFDTSNEEATK